MLRQRMPEDHQRLVHCEETGSWEFQVVAGRDELANHKENLPATRSGDGRVFPR